MGTSRTEMLIDYWNDRRPVDGVPDRSDIDPVDIPRLLPEIMLIERQPAGKFRIRLTGTAIVQCIGQDPTGWIFDEHVCKEGLQGLARLLTLAAKNRDIGEADLSADFATSDTYDSISTVALPLTRGGREIEVFMLSLTFNVTSRETFRRQEASTCL